MPLPPNGLAGTSPSASHFRPTTSATSSSTKASRPETKNRQPQRTEQAHDGPRLRSGPRRASTPERASWRAPNWRSHARTGEASILASVLNGCNGKEHEERI